ncbi:MAG: tRNA pseudouridine(38-40) synthase TruA [Blastocatellales bacterium]
MRYRITLTYDGTDYYGWQRQVSQPTIQSLLETALERIEGQHVTAHGAGRTDAGVHAAGQVVSFDLDREWDGVELRRALNGNLPPDIRVLSAGTASPEFHARFDSTGKTYRYQIWTAEIENPFLRRYAWHLWHRFDLEKLRDDLAALEGTHDFSAFTVTDIETSSRVRSVTETRFEIEGDLLTVCFSGDGFLRYQVRTMIGALVESNRGRLKGDSMAAVISSRNRKLIGAPAPAKGLTLMKVEY